MRLHFWKIACTLTFLFLNKNAVCHEVAEKSLSTSIPGMEELLETELALIENLDRYSRELQRKLETVRSGVATMRIEHQKSQSNVEEYLSNPLNSFSLIRRMHQDWIEWELYMAEPVGTSQIEEIQNKRNVMPSSTDLGEAVAAIHRLQVTYDLRPGDIAAGLLNGTQYNTRLSALDTFAIGNKLFEREEYYHAGFWLYTALHTIQDKALTTQNIRALYTQTMLKQDRPNDALTLIDISLKDKPHCAILLRLKAEVEMLAKTGNFTPRVYPTPTPTDYQRGCRGEFPQKLSKLHCRYNSTTSAFLKLAPLQMEEVYLDPYVVLYYNVISDQEIAELKKLASAKLTRATVYSESAEKSVVVDTRTSKFHWLPHNASDTTMRVNRRISDMTGFDLQDSERLQVMNYGLGGHYATHYDFFNTSETADVVREAGDRIATVMFYLSDVKQGGDTIFPNINITVHPHKGSAVIWYNLNNRGEGDWKTMHAACPVIVGSKWVCNMWIRANAQMFRKPCFKQ